MGKESYDGKEALLAVFEGEVLFDGHESVRFLAVFDSEHEVVAVYTQPDRPAGRGKKLTASPVKVLAEESNIPVYQPHSLKVEDAQQELAALALS